MHFARAERSNESEGNAKYTPTSATNTADTAATGHLSRPACTKADERRQRQQTRKDITEVVDTIRRLPNTHREQSREEEREIQRQKWQERLSTTAPKSNCGKD